MRDDHFLETITGKVKPLNIAVYDIESKSGDTQEPGFTRPFMVGFYDGLTKKIFRNAPHLAQQPWETRHIEDGGCIDKVMRHLLSPKYLKTNIYAHNGGSFDHLFILAWLARHPEFNFTVTPVQSSIQRIDVWKRSTNEKTKQKKWVFLDSMRLIPMGLDKAAKSFGLEGKKAMDLWTHEDDPLWDEYNIIDCEVNYNVVMRAKVLIEDLGGEIGMTAPSTAMKLYRRRYLGRGSTPEKIPRHRHFFNCLDDACMGCAHEWVRKAYYGGRTEIFAMRGENLRYYDLNSSYPASMKFDMPAGEMMEAETLDWRLVDKYVGFVECTVTIPPDCKVPPLPYRADSGKLIFPTGTFSGVWCAEELELLSHPLVRGTLSDIKKVVWYRKKPMFKEMVDHLYAFRDKKRPDYDKGLDAIAKLMLNSLYGKFGMKEQRQEIVFAENPPSEGHCILCHEETGRDMRVCTACLGSTPANGDIGCAVWYKKTTVSAPYIIPSIAAYITTLARKRLWFHMADVVSQGKMLAYVDTDSVLTDADLTTGTELGALKDEYPGELLQGEFIQPKVYILRKQQPFEGEHLPTCTMNKTDDEKSKCKGCATHKMAMKGLPKQERTLANLEKLQRGEQVHFTRLEKVRTLARGSFLTPPKISPVKKSIKSAYDKRLILADGVSTQAIVMKALPASPEHLQLTDNAAE